MKKRHCGPIWENFNKNQIKTVSQFISRIERQCCKAENKFWIEKFILRGLLPELKAPFLINTGCKQNLTYEECVSAAKIAEVSIRGPERTSQQRTNEHTESATTQTDNRCEEKRKCDFKQQECEYFNAQKIPRINSLNSRNHKFFTKCSNMKIRHHPVKSSKTAKSVFKSPRTSFKRSRYNKPKNTSDKNKIPQLFAQNVNSDVYSNCNIKVRIGKTCLFLSFGHRSLCVSY